MKLTNNLSFPAWLETVLTWAYGQYDKGAADFSVSQLASPAYLEKYKRNNELTQDLSQIVDLIIGKAIHSLFEAAFQATGIKGMRYEERIIEAFVVDGKTYKVSGQYDIFDENVGDLWDLKVTKVSAVSFGAKRDYIAQLNAYVELLSSRGLEVKRIRNLYILKDWSPKEKALAMLKGKDYPVAPMVIMELPLWTKAERMAWFVERIQAHTKAQPAPCSKDERWEKDPKYAVKKTVDAARAVNGGLFDADKKAEAEAMALSIKGVVESRPGERTRCEWFCPAAPVCKDWQEASK